MTDAIKEMVHQGDWLGLAAALAFAQVQPMPPVAILPDPPRPTTFTYGPASLVERVEKTLEAL